MDSAEIILHELRLIKSDVSDVKEGVSKLQVTVLGNGGKGHEQRIDDLEDWVDGRPKECPAHISRSDIYKRRGVEVAVLGIVLGLVQFVVDKLL